MSPEDVNVAICEALGLAITDHIVLIEIEIRPRYFPSVRVTYDDIVGDEFVHRLAEYELKPRPDLGGDAA